jgi:hypothetical protein
MFKRDRARIFAKMNNDRTHGFWRSAAQCLFGAVVLASLTYFCFRLQVNCGARFGIMLIELAEEI